MKKTIILFLLFFLAVPVIAREKNPKIEIADTLTDAFLDTVQVKKKLKLNDYSLIGVQYGAALSQVMWNPTQNQKMVLIPMNVGVTYTLYGKMFGYMPFFGIQTGIFYAREEQNRTPQNKLFYLFRIVYRIFFCSLLIL